MKTLAKLSSHTWLAVVAAGAVAGFAVAWAGFLHKIDASSVTVGKTIVDATASEAGSPALAYAEAVQQNDCDTVVNMVPWMHEHIEHVALKSSDPAERRSAGDALCEKVFRRVAEGNQIRREGIEDAYVFAPGATVKVAGTDEGRSDLERPVKTRVWLKVTYASRLRAPLDALGRPIRSLLVGVNLSERDEVLKAAVLGNLDIKRDSIQADWR